MYEQFNKIILASIKKLQELNIDVYTYAFYHDHESFAVSICVDTKEKSIETVNGMNEFIQQHFKNALEHKKLKIASSLKYYGTRSYEIGDFKCIDLCRTDLQEGIMIDDSFYLDMIAAIEQNKSEILKLSTMPEDVLFCCSTADSEVGIIWK